MVDQLLGGLFGAKDDDDDDRKRGRAQDFVSRYETGSPFEGYDMDEAAHNYGRVAGKLSPQEYEEAAQEAFQRMGPQERQQFAQMMRQNGVPDNDVSDDPRDLARATGRFRQQGSGGSGGGLASLFGMGGGGGSGAGDLLSASRGGGGGGGGGGGMGDMMSNPLAKAALGGIAAMAMKKMFR